MLCYPLSHSRYTSGSYSKYTVWVSLPELKKMYTFGERQPEAHDELNII